MLEAGVTMAGADGLVERIVVGDREGRFTKQYRNSAFGDLRGLAIAAESLKRLGFTLTPDGAIQWAWLVGAIACVNVVYGALSAMSQKDLKYVVAYSSVSHMGIVMLGMATLTEQGINGSVFQMIAHGIMTGLFFALVGLVYEKAHSREIFKMGGFATMMPGIATAFAVGGFSSLGLPATPGFVAEFLTFVGAWQSAHSWWLIPGVLGAFFTSILVRRSKISFEGPARVTDDPAVVAHAVDLYAARYRQPRVNPERVVLEMTVERVLGSAPFRA